MPIFSYKVRDETGRSVQGKMEAESTAVLIDKLRKLRYTVIAVTPIRPFISFKLELPDLFVSIKAEDYVMYMAQLSSMISSGMPLSQSLDTLSEQTDNRALRSATIKVAQDVRAGAAFAEALSRHPKVFPNLFVNMVAAGEVAGNIEEVLLKLTSFMEKSADLQQKVATALYYPVILMVFAVVVVSLIIVTVLPTFVKMFTEANVPLPLPTLILYKTNLFIRGYWKFLILSGVALAVAINYGSKTKIGKAFLDHLTLDLPIIGPMARKVNIARFTSTLASLLAAGVPLIQSLETMELVSENTVYKNVAREAKDYVSKGGSLAEQLRSSGEFPPMPIRMVAVGEETGKLHQLLFKISEFYEMSVDYSVKKMTSILEPIMLVIIGSIVAFIFASVLLPIFNMIKTIKT
jgi:type IV pilus assembly protein PilC